MILRSRASRRESNAESEPNARKVAVFMASP
jgi:hypothetical protein